MTAYEEFREGDPVNPFDYLVAEAKVAHLEEENEILRVKVRDCQQLAKGEQSLLDSLTKAYEELELLTEERDAALLALDEARAQHELHHGGPR